MPLEDLDPQSPAHWPQVQLFLAMAGPAPVRLQLIRTPWGLRLSFYDSASAKGMLGIDVSLSETETFASALRSLACWMPSP